MVKNINIQQTIHVSAQPKPHKCTRIYPCSAIAEIGTVCRSPIDFSRAAQYVAGSLSTMTSKHVFCYMDYFLMD